MDKNSCIFLNELVKYKCKNKLREDIDMFNQFKPKNDNTLKTVLAIVGGVFAVAAIVGAVIAVVKIVNKKIATKCCDGECTCDDCLCDDCWCEDEFCGEPCTCNDPLTVVSEGREVTDETESGESL